MHEVADVVSPELSRQTISLHLSFHLYSLFKRIVKIYFRSTYDVLKILLSLAFCLGMTQRSDAQRCRISAGVNDQGVRSYIEVYEYDYVTEKPSFPGGECRLLEYIKETRRYPKEAYDRGVQGRVTCSFVVNADGTISNITVLRSVNSVLNEEAIRIFSNMPAWTPGSIDGHPVPVRVIRSVPFRK